MTQELPGRVDFSLPGQEGEKSTSPLADLCGLLMLGAPLLAFALEANVGSEGDLTSASWAQSQPLRQTVSEGFFEQSCLLSNPVLAVGFD